MKKSLRKVLCLVSAICLMAALLAPAAFADDDIGFPAKSTITLVVPGKAGGVSDLAIRYYAQALTDIYGLKTTVTNYDSNTIGHQTVKSAKIGNIPGWHDLEESQAIRQAEYDQLVEIAKAIDLYAQG